MSSDPLTSEVSMRICNHMNTDHADAVLAFAEHYGALKGASSASMLAISTKHMIIEADGSQLTISLPHQISNSEEAHRTIIEMLKAIPKTS